MLPRAGLGDDARLAHALDEQRLPDRVVDLVRAGMVEVLTLEEDARVQAGTFFDALGEARRFGERRWTPDVLPVETGELLVEFWVGLGLRVYTLEFVEGTDERLRHIPAAVFAEVRPFVRAQRGLFRSFHCCSCLY